MQKPELVGVQGAGEELFDAVADKRLLENGVRARALLGVTLQTLM
jgi:hypothetical protein